MASATITISDEQWSAAEEAFYAKLEETGLGRAMPRARIDLIYSIIDTWEEMTPAQRRERSANAYFWRSKYMIISASADDEGQLVDSATMKPVVAHEDLFGVIRAVHEQSAHVVRACLCCLNRY